MIVPIPLAATLLSAAAIASRADGWRIETPGGPSRECSAPIVEGEAYWFPPEDLAAALGASVKVVLPDGPVVWCHGDLCAPIPLDGEAARREGKGIRIEIVRAAGHLGLRATVDGAAKVVTLEEAPEARPAPVSGRVEIGRPVPDLELSLLDGSRVRLSTLRGKRVLVQAWASW